jgi:hypothetical protein
MDYIRYLKNEQNEEVILGKYTDLRVISKE